MKIIEITSSSDNRKKHFKEYSELLKINNYDIVHSNADSLNFLYLFIAKKHGIKCRISHVHNTKHLTNSKIKTIILHLLKPFNKISSTHLFACSPEAGKFFYGRKSIQNGSCVIVKNAITFDKFKFSGADREQIRKDLNLENRFIIGHIGRFDYQKNHKFLIEYFNSYSKENENAVLVLIGEGHLKKEIISMTNKLKIEEKVVFLGNIIDVNKYYNIFDLFVLPSLFEGLGMVLIEAQANGLKCLASNHVPASSNILGNVDFLSLRTPNIWVEITKKVFNVRLRYGVDKCFFRKTGYSLIDECNRIQKIYMDILAEKCEGRCYD